MPFIILKAMNYLVNESLGDYKPWVLALEAGKTKNKVSLIVVKNLKSLLWSLVHLKATNANRKFVPTAFTIEDMSDNSVRLEWWGDSKERAVFVDVFEKYLILTNMNGPNMKSEKKFLFSNPKLIPIVASEIVTLFK